MIIFNRKEIPSQYTINDDMVLEINSIISIDELYDKLRKGEEVDPNSVSIHAYINGNGKVRLEDENMPEKAALSRLGFPVSNDSDRVLIGEDAVLTSEQVFKFNQAKGQHTPVREELFIAFEKYQFEHELDGYKIRPFNFNIANPQHKEVLRRHIALASGIMPNVYSEKDESGVFKYTLKEGVAISKEGKRLYRDFGKTSVGEDNNFPTLSEIAYLSSFNEYEKRLMGTMEVHPMKVVKLKKALEVELGNKEKGKLAEGVVISKDLYDALKKKSVEDVVKEKVSISSKPGIQELSDAFFEEHNFRPQVIPEYLEGARLAGDKSDNLPLAKAFSRPSVSAPVYSYADPETGKEKKITVAQTKNPALIYLASKINFAEIPQQLTRAISVYVNAENIGKLEKKGLSDWIKANKNTPVADFIEMLENADIIKKFDPQYSAKELSNYLDTALGDRDRKLFEHMYNYKFSDNEIAIKGRHLVVKQGNITMRMLAANDLKNFVTGYDTCCCQRWDNGPYHNGGKNYKKQVLERPATSYHNAGGSCVAHLTSDPFAANVVIERNGEVVGQSYVWTDEVQGIFVFDNIEWANDGDIQPYLNIIGVYAKNLPYPNVQLGMGCTQGLNGVGDKHKVTAHMPSTIKTRLDGIYTDYHGDARDLKRIDGRSHREVMVRYPINESVCQVTNAPDEPTKWDILASPQFNFMLNDNTKSIEERLEIARQFRENPTVELQKKVFDYCPSAILSIDNPDPGLQMEMYKKHPDIAKQIKNPCKELMSEIIADDPEMMANFSSIPEEIALQVLSANGLLLANIENPTDEMIKTALAQNGYAFMYREFPKERLTEEMTRIAVTSSPRVVTLLENPSEEVQMIAAEKDPESIAVMEKPCIRAQMSAVRRMPQLIMRDAFKDAEECVVRCAIESDPMVISAFQWKYPGLRMEAIEKNGFAVRELSGVTPEEYSAAVRQNPAVARLVPPPTGQVTLTEEPEDIGIEIG